MNDRRPLAFGASCPKCEATLRGDFKYCKNIDCKTWRTFGGEHLHIQCSLCKYVRTTHCADFKKDVDDELDDINRHLDELVEEYNLQVELDPDWEPSSLEPEKE